MSFDLMIKNGDIAIGANGDLQKIENTDKLVQDLLKMAITPLNSNIFYPWYGSPISKSLIGTPFDMQFISTIATNQLRGSIETLQKMQGLQASFQNTTPSEQIAAIQQISIQRNQVDPRFFLVSIKVLTKDMTVASAFFSMSPTL